VITVNSTTRSIVERGLNEYEHDIEHIEHIVELWINGRRFTSGAYPTRAHAQDDARALGSALLPAMVTAPRPNIDPEQYVEVEPNPEGVFARVKATLQGLGCYSDDVVVHAVIKAVLP
jgi:hypothetical protein